MDRVEIRYKIPRPTTKSRMICSILRWWEKGHIGRLRLPHARSTASVHSIEPPESFRNFLSVFSFLRLKR